MKNNRLILLVILLFAGCGKTADNHAPRNYRAFYYWLTDHNNFSWNDSTFTSLNVRKIYYRFFDVDWDEEERSPVPVSPVNFDYFYLRDTTLIITPVVFITNETFKNLDVDASRQLARNVHKKVITQIRAMKGTYVDVYKDDDWWEQDPYQMKSADFKEMQRRDSILDNRVKQVAEIQFDCDWTKTTRDKYFAFLEEAKKLFNTMTVTSTVRLYQYKYPDEAGVPPVSRGMLMCYNAGDVKNISEPNSIFDKNQVMSYLDGPRYPIALDYALPVFAWGLHFREDKLIGIKPLTSLLEEYRQYFTEDGENMYVVSEDFVDGYSSNSDLFRIGDKLKVEQPDIEDVREVADWLSENRNNPEAILTLYHLNDYDVRKHSKAIEDIFNSF